MTTDKARVPWPEAERIAAETLRLLEPACAHLCVAGSIRCRKPWVGDLELLAIPKTRPAQTDLFGTPSGEVSELEALVDALLAAGTLALRADKHGRTASGDKYKRLWCRGGLFPLDLFVARPASCLTCGRLGDLSPLSEVVSSSLGTCSECGGPIASPNFGILLAIRTGPASFSHRLVTPRLQGGWMPAGLRVEGGWLWDGGARVPTPDEAAVFGRIGARFLPPERRTETVALRWSSGGYAWVETDTLRLETVPLGGRE